MNQFENLFEQYIALEKKIQGLIYPISRSHCSECDAICCKEDFCRESIESPFLRALVERQHVQYDKQYGWIGPTGCRLAYGRPLVCYDFFCDKLMNMDGLITAEIRSVLKNFLSVGNKAHGNRHLVCVDDLEKVSLRKIEVITHRVALLLEKITI